MPFFCAVPPTLPPSAEGVRDVPGRGAVLRQGVPPQPAGRDPAQPPLRRQPRAPRRRLRRRPQRRASPDEKIGRVVTGRADWTYTLPGIALQSPNGLIQKYLPQPRAVLRSSRGLTVSMYVLNSSGPFFREQPDSYDRRSTSPSTGTRSHALGVGDATDQYLPPGVAGLQASERSTRSRATSPARGRWRQEISATERPSSTFPTSLPARNTAQQIKLQLAEIGLDVEIQPFGEHATASSYLGRLGSPTSRGTSRSCSGRPTTSIPPRTSTGCSTASSPARRTSTRFDEPPFTEPMRKASRLQGAARSEGLRRARPAARPRRRTARRRSSPSTRRPSSRRASTASACSCGRGSF